MAKSTGIEAHTHPVEGESYKANDGLEGSGSMEMRGERGEEVDAEVLEQGIEALESRGKKWYAYLLTRDFWLVLAIGYVALSSDLYVGSELKLTGNYRQILALCITATNTFSTLLVNKGTSIPAFQTLFNYVVLTALYTTYTIWKYGPKKYFKLLLVDGWKYIILSFMDVEGNYFTVLAYRYVRPILPSHYQHQLTSKTDQPPLRPTNKLLVHNLRRNSLLPPPKSPLQNRPNSRYPNLLRRHGSPPCIRPHHFRHRRLNSHTSQRRHLRSGRSYILWSVQCLRGMVRFKETYV